jgi:hypothetical protein
MPPEDLDDFKEHEKNMIFQLWDKIRGKSLSRVITEIERDLATPV